jgi:hypothetical protein
MRAGPVRRAAAEGAGAFVQVLTALVHFCERVRLAARPQL